MVVVWQSSPKSGQVKGFTLVESLLAIVVLATMAGTISAIYISGLNTVAALRERALMDSALRSRMEENVARPFSSIVSDSRNVTINDLSFTLVQTVSIGDLNGDAVPEPTSKFVTITVAERPSLTLSMLLVHDEDLVGKI